MNNIDADINRLEVALLEQALSEMIRRFKYAAKEAGYSENFVRTCTESEEALLGRVREEK